MDQQKHPNKPSSTDSYDDDLRAFREARVSDAPAGDTAAAASSSSFLYHNSEELEDMLVDTLDQMKLGTQAAVAAGSSHSNKTAEEEDRSMRMSFGCWTAQDKTKWTCDACTFVNEPLHLTCTVCEKPKGLSGLGNNSSVTHTTLNGSSTSHRSSRSDNRATGMTISNTTSNGTSRNSNDEDYDPFLEQLRQERKAEVLELQNSILSQAALEKSRRGIDDSSESNGFNNNNNNNSRRSPVPYYAPLSPAPSIPVPPRAMSPLLADRSVAPLSPARRARQARRQQQSPPRAGRVRSPVGSEEDEVFNVSEQEAKEMRKLVAMQSTTASSSAETKGSHTPATKSQPSPVLAARTMAIHDMPALSSSSAAASPFRTPVLPLRPQPRVNNNGRPPSDYGESLDPDILEKIAMRDGSNREGNHTQQHVAVRPGAYQANPGAQAVRRSPETMTANTARSRQQSTSPTRRMDASPLATAKAVPVTRKMPPRARHPAAEQNRDTLDADVLEKIARFSREGTSNNGTAPATVASQQRQSQPGAYRNQPDAAAVRNTSVTQNMKGGSIKPAARSTTAVTVTPVAAAAAAEEECARVVPRVAIADAQTPHKNCKIGSSETQSPTRKRDKVKNAARDILKNGLTFRKNKTK